MVYQLLVPSSNGYGSMSLKCRQFIAACTKMLPDKTAKIQWLMEHPWMNCLDAIDEEGIWDPESSQHMKHELYKSQVTFTEVVKRCSEDHGALQSPLRRSMPLRPPWYKRWICS
jgi:hypothetical protein